MKALCEDWAERRPDRPALHDVESGLQWDYRQLNRMARYWVCRLSAEGVRRGDRVVWLARNRLDFFAVLLACQRQGWVLVPLNWREVIDVQLAQARLVEPTLILAEADFHSVATSLHRLLGCGLAWLDDDRQAGELPPAEPSGDAEPWYLLFTSGTTGAPKAVIYTRPMAEANAANVDQALALSEADVTASALPHYHTAGINLFALPVLLHGGSVRVYRHFRPERLMDDLLNAALTRLLLVPTQYRRLSETPAFRDRDDLSAITASLASGGAPLDAGLLAEWTAKGALIRNGCGMTESGPTLFFQTAAQARRKPGSVGRPMSLSECRLVGPQGETVAEGEVGEVWVRGPAVTPGYWRNADANRRAFSDGWYRSGDLARRDAEGDYFIVDRVTDLFICGGENVYPTEVEQCLLGHHCVQEVAVTGEYDRTWGETAAAFVVLRPGYWADDAELRAFCQQRLATYKVPRRLVFLDELPRTPTGKIRRAEVRSWVRHSE